MIYTVEHTRWSICSQQFVRFRLTYLRTWMNERELWRDFLVRAEELKSPQELISSEQSVAYDSTSLEMVARNSRN